MHPSRTALLRHFVSCVLAFAAFARGATPRVLDVIPADGPLAVVAVDNLERSDGRLQALLAAVMDGPGHAGLAALLEAMGVRAGIDMSGSAAVMVMPGAGEAQPPQGARLLLLVPVSDEQAFWAGVHAHDEGGVKTFCYIGVNYFARAFARSYVLIGDDRLGVEAFALPKDGSAAAWVNEFGPVGARVVTDADIVAIATPADFLSLVDAIQGLVLNADSTGAAPGRLADRWKGPGEAAGEAPFDGYFPGRSVQLIKSESRGVLMGVSFDPGALRVDVASTFVGDGVLNKVARSPPEAGAPSASPLATMPAEPYLFALGIDAAHPGVRVLADELGPPGRSTRIGVQAELAVLGAIPSMEALSIVVYEPASVMFGSLARAMVAWRAPAPEEAARAFRSWIESLNQRPLGNAVITSTYAPGAVGTVDAWTITPPAGAVPVLPMLLGPVADVQGKTLVVPGKGYLSCSRDAKLFESAGRAGEAGATALDREERLEHVSSMLPRPRIMEAYLDASSIVKQFAPMVAGEHEAEMLPEKLSPVGAALTAEEGVACVTLVAPADVLRVLNVLNRSEPDDAPPPEEKPKRPRRGRRGD